MPQVTPSVKSNIIHGALWMVVAAWSFTAMLICVRYLAGRYPAIEVVFFRAMIGLLFVLPPLLSHGVPGLRTQVLRLHLIRACFGLTAMLCYYYAAPRLPLADITTYSFAIPLFVTLGAVIFLKEKVDAPRWLATVVGFFGVLIMLWPGFSGHAQIPGTLAVTYMGFSLPVLMVMLSVFFYAGAWISMKFLTRTEEASIIVFYQNIITVPLVAIPTFIFGSVPDLHDFGLLAGVGIFGAMAHFAQARSFGAADASAVMPYDFLRLPFAVACAWLMFSEVTGVWTWAGAVIIFGATYYITWHETRLRRLRLK
jgi:drug/metabolite transporter (DMT)-like permease